MADRAKRSSHAVRLSAPEMDALMLRHRGGSLLGYEAGSSKRTESGGRWSRDSVTVDDEEAALVVSKPMYDVVGRVMGTVSCSSRPGLPVGFGSTSVAEG
jgi:hypothetical protein